MLWYTIISLWWKKKKSPFCTPR